MEQNNHLFFLKYYLRFNKYIKVPMLLKEMNLLAETEMRSFKFRNDRAHR